MEAKFQSEAELSGISAGRIFFSESYDEARENVRQFVDRWDSYGHLLQDYLSRRDEDYPVYIDYASDRRWFAKQVLERVTNIATYLLDHYNFKRETVCCLSCENDDMNIMLSLGIIFAGGIVASHYSKDPYAELLYLSRKTRPKILICDESKLDWVKRLNKDLGYEIDGIVMDGYKESPSHQPNGSKCTRFSSLFHYDHKLSQSKAKVPIKIPRDELKSSVAVVLMSSGSTGQPKAVPATHYNCITDIFPYSINNRAKGVHVACISSLDYVSGRILLIGAITSGYTTIILNGFNPESYLDTIQKFRVFVVYLGAASFYKMITHEKVEDYDLSSLHTIFPMGAKIVYLDELHEFCSKHPSIRLVRQGYGSSECSGVALKSMAPDEYLNDCENCGQLVAATSAKIVDPDSGELLGTNQKGMLLVKGPTVFPGYYDVGHMIDHGLESPFINGPEFVDEDGYFITGDLAYFNDKNELYISGRQKEIMVCRGAKKVLPQELEELIKEHGCVSKVCVLGVPNRRELTLHCPRAFILPKKEFYELGSDDQLIESKLNELIQKHSDDSIVDQFSSGDADQLKHEGRHKLCNLDSNLRQRLAEHLMHYVNHRIGWEKQLTGGIVFLDEFPLLRTGKIDKTMLRSLDLNEVEIYGDRSRG